MNFSSPINYRWIIGVLFLVAVSFSVSGNADMYLKERFLQAQPGDYIVTAIDNTYTILLIKEKHDRYLSIEEITIPSARFSQHKAGWQGWKPWVENNAPGHTSWVVYTINCVSGEMQNFFSYTKNTRCQGIEGNNFISMLLNLKMSKVPNKKRKKIGPPPSAGARDMRRVWVPKMVHEGQIIQGVPFEAWRTRWPQDTSDLCNKVIIAYLPQDTEKYPSYFPYWLEIHGLFGKAKIRIIDSGSRLQSPHSSPLA